MVKNVGGGDKMKHMARKHVNGAKNSHSKILRTSTCDDEKYGYVVKIVGNGMCIVKCIDGYERLCFIRGKFSGRSKRENTIVAGTWVLVGLRQWDAEKEFASKQTKTGKSIQKCDLLEIYTPSEREKLRIQEKIFQDLSSENSDDEFQLTKQSVEFKDQETLEYQEIVEQGGMLSRMKKSSYSDLYDNISSESDDDGNNIHNRLGVNANNTAARIADKSEEEEDEDEDDCIQSANPNPSKQSIQAIQTKYNFAQAEINIDDI